MIYYLKAQDEATFHQALLDCGWAWEEQTTDYGGIIEAGVDYITSTHILDVIGTIYVETGVMITPEPDEDGFVHNDYPELEAIDGYHVNLKLIGEKIPEELKQFIIDEPSVPYRIFT